MTNVLKSITAYGKDKSEIPLTKTQLVRGKGIVGDRHYSDEENHITVLFRKSTSLNQEPQVADDRKIGLCTKKFKANLIVETSDPPEDETSDELVIGNAILEVTKAKHCYNDCPLRINDYPCELRDNAFFLTVKEAGTIKENDSVYIRGNNG